eukprot:COSAG06_NODE_336_length_17272_cov_50.456647_4_plen_174_part_00
MGGRFKDAVHRRVSLHAKKPALFREGGVRGRGFFFETRSLLWCTQVFGGWRTTTCAFASSLHQLARADQRGFFSRAWCAPAARRQRLILPSYGPSTSSGSRAPPLRRHPRSVCPCAVRCLVATALKVFKAMRYAGQARNPTLPLAGLLTYKLHLLLLLNYLLLIQSDLVSLTY